MPVHNDHRRIWLGVLLVSCGMLAIVTQSLLLREALVLMFGSEFAWGVVLFAWLFGVAVGARLGGWAAERVTCVHMVLVAVLIALGFASCIELWVFRGARAWLGVETGEFLPLGTTALAAMLFVSPVSALVGMAFPIACCVGGSPKPRACVRVGASNGLTPPAKADIETRRREGGAGRRYGLLSLAAVYALESTGSLIGGAVFSFWAVEHLSPIQTALACTSVTAAASAGFLAATTRRRVGAACLATVAGAVLAMSVLAGGALNRKLVERRWRNVAPGYELCAEAESKYQNLAVGRRAEQFTLYSDGQVTADFPDPYTFVPLAHFWMCQHPRPRNVLVIGGGAEGLLAEILRHPVDHVDYVEPDPRLIELIEPFLGQQDRRALSDARITVHHVDPRHFVKTQADRFDLVIARLPEPMSAMRARLYTEEFYRELRGAMKAQSVLCMTAAATPGQLSAASAEYLASIRETLREHFPHVTVGWGNPAQILAATERGLVSTDPAELVRRYAERGVRSDLFAPAWFEGATDWLEPEKLRRRAAELDAAGNVAVSTDLHPVVYLQRLALWEKMVGRPDQQIISRLRSVGWAEVVAVLLAITALTVLACYVRTKGTFGFFAALRVSAGTRRGKRGAKSGLTPAVKGGTSPSNAQLARAPWLSNSAILLSIGTTGFSTMALSIILLFAFQNFYGYVYQRIGWIVALFMAGLVAGCWLAGRRPARDADSGRLIGRVWGRLILVDTLLALLALAVPLVLPILGGLPSGPLTFVIVEWCISSLVFVTGVLGGAAFALAGALQLGTTSRPGTAAGSVVSADHAGACLGALACGILLVPVFGTVAAALLLAGVKLGAAGLLVAGRRRNVQTLKASNVKTFKR